MPAVPKRFIITYLLAFALMCICGWRVASKEAGGITGSKPDGILLHLFRGWDGSVQILTLNEEEDRTLNLLSVALNLKWIVHEREDRIGSALIPVSHEARAAAPFMVQPTFCVAFHNEDLPSDLPEDVLIEARRKLVRHTLASLAVPRFSDSDLRASWDRLELKHEPRPLVSPWLIPILFAFIPFLTAWIVTVAATRRKPNPT